MLFIFIYFFLAVLIVCVCLGENAGKVGGANHLCTLPVQTLPLVVQLAIVDTFYVVLFCGGHLALWGRSQHLAGRVASDQPLGESVRRWRPFVMSPGVPSHRYFSEVIVEMTFA